MRVKLCRQYYSIEISLFHLCSLFILKIVIALGYLNKIVTFTSSAYLSFIYNILKSDLIYSQNQKLKQYFDGSIFFGSFIDLI